MENSVKFVGVAGNEVEKLMGVCRVSEVFRRPRDRYRNIKDLKFGRGFSRDKL
jgi:hypothetical protein